MKTLLIAVMLILFSHYVPPGSRAEDAHTTATKHPTASTEAVPIRYKKPIKMNEPMTTGMAKPGMKKGDVKKHAEHKEARMDEEMQKEEMKH